MDVCVLSLCACGWVSVGRSVGWSSSPQPRVVIAAGPRPSGLKDVPLAGNAAEGDSDDDDDAAAALHRDERDGI
jgi:hypothetical protein